MSKKKRNQFQILFRLGIGALLVLASCVSAPHFEPSRPPETARTFQEGLWICHHYRMPDEAGRRVVYRPYVDCVKSLEKSQVIPPSSAFPVFAHEIRAIYDFLNEIQWSENYGRDLEIGTQAVFRALWNEGGGQILFTPEEKLQALTHFPLTASALGAEEWKTQEGLWVDPDLEWLKAMTFSFLRPKGVPVAPKEPQKWAQLCTDLHALAKEVDYLDSVWSDMAQLARLPEGQSVRVRREQGYRDQVKRAREKLNTLANEIDRSHLENQISREACGGL